MATAGNLNHRECTIELALSGDSGWQPANQFKHVAEAHHLPLRMNLSAIKLALEKLENTPPLPGLASFAHKMGLQVYADGVIEDAELAALQTVPFDGAAGSAVNNPA